MKKLLILAALGLIASNAMAMSSYVAKSVNCATIHEKIAQDGAVVLKFPSHQPGLEMYNRYVSNSMMCVGQGNATATKVASLDDPACPVMTCTTATGKGHTHK